MTNPPDQPTPGDPPGQPPPPPDQPPPPPGQAPPPPAQSPPPAGPAAPTGPPPGYQAAPPQYGSGTVAAPQGQPGISTAALVCGIIGIPFSLFCIAGIILSILAIIFGVQGIKQSAARGVSTSIPRAGLICGVVGVGVYVLALIVGVAIGISGS